MVFVGHHTELVKECIQFTIEYHRSVSEIGARRHTSGDGFSDGYG